SAGLLAGDEVIQVEGRSVTTWEEFTNVVKKSPNEAIDIVVSRGNDQESLTITPNEVEDVEGNKIGQVGVLLANEKSFVKTFEWGFTQTFMTTKLIIKNLVVLVTG